MLILSISGTANDLSIEDYSISERALFIVAAPSHKYTNYFFSSTSMYSASITPSSFLVSA